MAYNEINFKRMIEGADMMLAEMGLKAHEYKPHTSKILKIEADPDTPNHVWVYVPEVIFMGSKTNEECSSLTVEQWAQGLSTLAKLFSVKGHTSARMMSPASAKDARIYANYFWARDESVKGDMTKWNIVLEDTGASDFAETEETTVPAAEVEAKGAKREPFGFKCTTHHTLRMQDIEAYQKRYFFMCM